MVAPVGVGEGLRGGLVGLEVGEERNEGDMWGLKRLREEERGECVRLGVITAGCKVREGGMGGPF